MNHLSLFSGIGGLDLAAEWAGFRTVAFVERDAYCQAVLRKRWPGVPIVSDVRAVVADTNGGGSGERPRLSSQSWSGLPDVDGSGRSGPGARGSIVVDAISGGFPCQPHSVAGKRGASGDERDLWPEFARIIGELKPRWVVAENVPGLLTSERGAFFGRVLEDLAALGYRAGWGSWRASDVGALHRRERVFIVAHAGHTGPSRTGRRNEHEGEERQPFDGGAETVADAQCERGCGRHSEREDAEDARQRSQSSRHGTWDVEPDVGRVAHGVPSRVHRLRALGNAVVPQQAYPLFAAIARAEGMN